MLMKEWRSKPLLGGAKAASLQRAWLGHSPLLAAGTQQATGGVQPTVHTAETRRVLTAAQPSVADMARLLRVSPRPQEQNCRCPHREKLSYVDANRLSLRTLVLSSGDVRASILMGLTLHPPVHGGTESSGRVRMKALAGTISAEAGRQGSSPLACCVPVLLGGWQSDSFLLHLDRGVHICPGERGLSRWCQGTPASPP